MDPRKCRDGPRLQACLRVATVANIGVVFVVAPMHKGSLYCSLITPTRYGICIEMLGYYATFYFTSSSRLLVWPTC
jgi:hypothetical protein